MFYKYGILLKPCPVCGSTEHPHKAKIAENSVTKAKVDSKKRLTLRESPYDYYHVEHYSDGRIMLQPRELVEPFRVSENTLSMMDKSMENVKKGKAGKAVDLSKFEE